VTDQSIVDLRKASTAPHADGRSGARARRPEQTTGSHPCDRYLDIDYHHDDFLYDMATGGFCAAVGIRF